MDLESRIAPLETLLFHLQREEGYSNKIALLNAYPPVAQFLTQSQIIYHFLALVKEEGEYVIKITLALGQGEILFNEKLVTEAHTSQFVVLLEQLLELEAFYRDIGGILGYHLTVLRLIVRRHTPPPSLLNTHYLHPEGLHVEAEEEEEVHHTVRWGIESLPTLALLCPLGGAGERLNLREESTGHPLPVACLPFLGFTLLEGLIRDLQALEYLYYKLYGKTIAIPVAIMTSVEKNNHQHVLRICKERKWFGRDPSSFYFFIQPVVPVITEGGDWSLSEPLKVVMKPSGHGVLWKLAEEQGVFDWLRTKGCFHTLIRQINNPLAATDHSLLALVGKGCRDHKAFGFVSCARPLHSEEGMNVLIEQHGPNGYTYCVTNVEYTDLTARGIEDLPGETNNSFSRYPANTNICFAHLPSIQALLKENPIPGQLINMKSTTPYIDRNGHRSEVIGGRLESTMQNIADCLVDSFSRPLNAEEQQLYLRTFVIYHERGHTISTTKKAYKEGTSRLGTPEQAYHDLLLSHYLLLQKCQVQLPPWREMPDFLQQGPTCLFLFHPALGPPHSLIRQKIRGGSFASGAELQLEIAEVDIESLVLEGSLLIQDTGYQNGIRLATQEEGRCTLRNVVVRNKGLSPQQSKSYWKNDLTRIESVIIQLEEGSEFYAEEVVIEGAHVFHIPSHHRLVLKPAKGGGWSSHLTPLSRPSWHWHYQMGEDNRLRLLRFS